MKKNVTFAFMVVLTFCLPLMGEAGDIWKKVYDLANVKLAQMGTAPEIVSSVIEHNKSGMSLDEIKNMDKKWVAAQGTTDVMAELMTSSCAKVLKQFQASAPYYAEIFVMGNQGAIVAMTDKTSDYWQGDEDKFQKSFNQGKGRVFVGDVEFDDSSNTFLVQVSVPVISKDKAIGAITFGINIEKFR